MKFSFEVRYKNLVSNRLLLLRVCARVVKHESYFVTKLNFYMEFICKQQVFKCVVY